MRRLPLVALVGLLPSLLLAQSSDQPSFRLGYTFSGHFTGRPGQSGVIEGPELGVDIPIGPKVSLPTGQKISFFLSPSYFAGGRLRRGSDLDGDVFRLLAVGQIGLGSSGLYGRLGVGASYADDRGNQFHSGTAYEVQYALGVPILKNPTGLRLNAEVTYHQSSKVQVQGWTFGINAQF